MIATQNETSIKELWIVASPVSHPVLETNIAANLENVVVSIFLILRLVTQINEILITIRENLGSRKSITSLSNSRKVN